MPSFIQTCVVQTVSIINQKSFFMKVLARYYTWIKPFSWQQNCFRDKVSERIDRVCFYTTVIFLKMYLLLGFTIAVLAAMKVTLISRKLVAMWFLPSALNVKVKKFNQARVNGGSNYDSLNGNPGEKCEAYAVALQSSLSGFICLSGRHGAREGYWSWRACSLRLAKWFPPPRQRGSIGVLRVGLSIS